MIGLALLGCGRIGRIHAANIAAHPKARLVRVFDPVEAAVAAVVARCGGRPAADAAEAIRDPEVAAVVIATPTDTHLELLAETLEAGRWAFLEKPIDLDIRRVLAARRRLAPALGRVQLGFNRRFDPHFRAFRRELQQLGRLYRLRITSFDPEPPPVDYLRRSGGLFRDMTIHDFDMARFLLPAEPRHVVAVAAARVDEATLMAGDVDVATVVLESEDGLSAVIENCRRAAYGYDQRLEALGEKGLLQADNPRPTTLSRWHADATAARDPLLPFFLERYAASYQAELDAFLQAIITDAAPSPGFEDGVRAQLLAEAAVVAHGEGRRVDVRTLEATLDAG